MAEDIVNKAIKTANLPPIKCITKNLSIHGNIITTDYTNHLNIYGSDKEALLLLLNENALWAEKMHTRLPYLKVEVIWAIRNEMAINLEDVLARRLRALFLDARAAIEIASVVASLMAKEFNHDKTWEEIQVNDFIHLAQGYLLMGS